MRDILRFGLLLPLLAAATAAAAQPLRSFSDLALSPAGDQVAAVESMAEPDAAQVPRGAIVLRAADSGRILRQIDPCPTCTLAAPAFAPRGPELAYLVRDSKAGTTALVVADAAGSGRTLATVNGIAARPRWSPDGSEVALLVTIGARKEAGATQAGVALTGEIGAQNDEQRIAVVPAAGGPLRLVSPADRYVYEYDWTPDGRSFVVTSAAGNGDNNWWVATLDRIDVATGALSRIAAPKLQIEQPRVSPDGKTVAFIGGLMSDFGSIGGDVWTVPLAGCEPVNLTRGDKATATSLLWPAAGLRATTLRSDRAELVGYKGAGFATLWSTAAALAAGDARAAFSADGTRIATIVQDFEHGPAIYAGPPQAPRQITHDNDGYPAVAHARSIRWRSDGYDVQGWLLAPATAEPAAKAAMITIVHGGPSAAHVPGFVWQGINRDLIRAGYYLFLPNPRGSYGQGEAFVQANKRDFGRGDLRDIVAGVDAAEKAAPIDDARLGLSGGSYGGFMAMFAPTQTHRFKAVVAGAGISNWISYYGTNGIDQWMIPFLGASAYDDPAAYRAMSAIDFIRQHRTPTFIYVGERDVEVPPTQSIEMWHALQAVGVPTSLVIYEGEGHGLRDPAHMADERKRAVAWFGRYLAPAR